VPYVFVIVIADNFRYMDPDETFTRGLQYQTADASKVSFSTWDYARQRCANLCAASEGASI